MKRLVTLFVLMLVFVSFSIAQEQGSVIITELMYNPASSEATTETQYIEIANTTNNPISLLNWTIDDEDADGPNTLPDVTLNPYEIAIICGSSAADFEGAWGTGYRVISLKDDNQTMFNMANSPSSTSEIIQLRDDSNNLIDEVNYDDANPWPVDNNQSSIYLSIPKDQMNATSNNDGANWSLSVSGSDGAFSSTPSGVWDNVDIGSPGNIFGDQTLPVELTSFTAKAGDRFVQLRWSTASELDNQGFKILRSEEKKGLYDKIDSWETNPALRGAGTSTEEHSYQFVDHSVFNGVTYWYKLVDVDVNGARTEHGPVFATPHQAEITVDPVNGDMPQTFSLHQNFPNPFNPATTIRFDIPQTKDALVEISLKIYDISGRLVKTLVNGQLPPGPYKMEWKGTDENGNVLSTGLYIVQFKTPFYSSARKMMLAK